MKDYLIGENETQAVNRLRHPFQLLQYFQCTLNHIMSSSDTSSSPTSRAKTSRLKKQSTITPATSKDLSHIKKTAKLSTASSRSVSLKLNSHGKVPQGTKNSVIKKPSDMPAKCRNKMYQTSDLNRNSVGSLTSSPKWSHIKKKFENSETISSKPKLANNSSLPPEDDNLDKSKLLPKRTPSKSLSLIPDSNYAASNRICKVNTGKDVNIKIPLNGKGSAMNESSFNKDFNQTDTNRPTSSVSLLKEKEKLNYLKDSHLDISVPSISSRIRPNGISLVKNNTINKSKSDSSAGKSYNDKPVLTFKGEKPSKIENTSSSSYISGTIAGQILNTRKLSETSPSVSFCGAPNKTAKNNQGQITQLITNESSHDKSGKTVWIKDISGNWIKKSANGNAHVKSTNHVMKVSLLRNKFYETSKEIPAKIKSQQHDKSLITSSVPCRSSIAKANRYLSKPVTANSICDKKYSEDNNYSKFPAAANELNNKSFSVLSKKIPENLLNKTKATVFTIVPQSKSKSADDVSPERASKLNLVQRAVLSYEGNLSLLSPETRKRLKLISEKVKAQTDDDKILVAKSKNNYLSFKAYSPQYSNYSKTESDAQNYNCSELGERLQPVRSFLTRYQQRSRPDSNNISRTSKSSLNSQNDESLISSNTISKNLSSSLPFKKDNNIKIITNDSIHKETERNGLTSSRLSATSKMLKGCNSGSEQGQEKKKNISPKSAVVKVKYEPLLLPNSSFLWRNSDATSSELSKSSTTSSASLASSDFKNYYDIDNYYSSVEVEIEKHSETSDEPIYIDSQGSGGSDSCYASASFHPYQNITQLSGKIATDDGWADMSDEEQFQCNSPSNQNSTLRRKKNKRSSSQKDSDKSDSETQVKTLHKYEKKKPLEIDAISFTDSSDTLMNDEIENECGFDLNDSNNFYEPVYESLGNYLLSDDTSLSPDDDRSTDLMQSSFTSLESFENLKSDHDLNDKNKPEAEAEASNEESKKSSNKISQLRRHLSWTKNDIRLELSSKFNKIKIKKNSTEIGVKVQESNESVSTSPKKKTLIKCILRQKSTNSIPVKSSPSPKKENAMFYVHLSMGREKQCGSASDGSKAKHLQNRKPSEASLTVPLKPVHQLPKVRKLSAGPVVQRPKTAPPLPPTAQSATKGALNSSAATKISGASVPASDLQSDDRPLYAVLDPEFFCTYSANEPFSLSKEYCEQNGNAQSSVRLDENDMSTVKGTSICNSTKNEEQSNDLILPLLSKFTSELLKSPFEEEPMYQFYHKDVQQRATLWYTADGSESEFDDDAMSKVSESENPQVKPVLQSQLSAMELVHGVGGLRTLWCEVPEVIKSGILESTSPQERKIQEAMFEVITSEASYLKSLNFLLEHFVACPELSGNVLDKRERHILFSDIQPVRDASTRLLADLEKHWLENIVLSNVCDIVYRHASRYFSVYVKYCSNQLYQERTLRELKDKRPAFVSVLKRLEASPVCQGLDMRSFLLLPMQRVTRLPLLVDAILRRLVPDLPLLDSCRRALATLNKLVAECNEGARKMERMEEMLVISQQLDFKECKEFGLLSASRWLVKKGELVQLVLESSGRRTFGRALRWCKVQLYLFLFTDFLVVTRKKCDDIYSVVDYCPRNMVQVVPVDENTPLLRLPSSYRNIFQMIMLNNKEGKTVEMLLSCLLESDRTRWMNAVTPVKSENPDEKIYEEWDCPQVQCTHAYVAQQPDELSLEETDVVNIFRKMVDGWLEGERMRDGMRGWFPASHVVEIINSHVRARNLHQRYRLLALSQTYLEEQYKAHLHSKK